MYDSVTVHFVYLWHSLHTKKEGSEAELERNPIKVPFWRDSLEMKREKADLDLRHSRQTLASLCLGDDRSDITPAQDGKLEGDISVPCHDAQKNLPNPGMGPNHQTLNLQMKLIINIANKCRVKLLLDVDTQRYIQCTKNFVSI